MLPRIKKCGWDEMAGECSTGQVEFVERFVRKPIRKGALEKAG